MPLLGGQHQRGSQERTPAGRPSQGENHAEDHCGKEVHVLRINMPASAVKQVQFEHTQKVEAEKDHHRTGNDVHKRLMLLEKATDRSGQRPENHKDDAETRHKAHGTGQRLAHASLSAARKVGNIDGQHRQETRR